MAEGRLVVNLRDDYLTCSICVETYNNPKSLECGHSFCFKCLEEYFRSTPEVRDVMVCPICRRKTILQLHEDPREVIDSLSTEQVLLSVLRAVGPHLAETKDNENPTDCLHENDATGSFRQVECMCDRHKDKRLEVYCSKHDIVVCSECAWKEHKDEECKCLQTQDVINKRYNALKCLVAQQIADASQLIESKDQTNDTLDSLHETFQRSIADVEEQFEDLCKTFRQRIKQLKENATETVEKDVSANAVKDLQIALTERIKFFENDRKSANPNRALKDISEMFATSSKFQVHIGDLSDKVKAGSLLWNCEKDLCALDKFMTISKQALPDQFLPYSESVKDNGDDSEYVVVTNSGQFADSKESIDDGIDSFQQFTFSAKQTGEQVCNLSSIALVGTTALVVVDQMNRKIKKFKIPEGKFLSEIQLELDPYQVATLPESSHLVVTVWDVPKILILASDPIIEILRIVDTDTEYIGVASHITGILAVSSMRHSRVDILDINQANLNISNRETVSQTSRVRNIPDRLAITRSQSVIVRNKRRNEVKCVDKEKKILWSRRFKSPIADVACFRGKVFASLVKKNEIFCFHENGIEDVRSFKPSKAINNPWSMDGFKDCLVVTEDSPSDLVHVFVFSCCRAELERPTKMAETATEEGSVKSNDTVANTSLSTDRENLDRLLRIFNGGTGVNLGTSLVQVVEMQAKVDSSTLTPESTRLADIVTASLKAYKYRKDPKIRLQWEEAKEPVRVAQYGRGNKKAGMSEPVESMESNNVDDNADSESVRRVTLDDRRQPPKVVPHLTQRVKTFYMDPFLTLATKRDDILIPNVPTKSARARSMIGGTPITRETAIELRRVTLGSTVHSFCFDWRKSSLKFHDLSTSYAYGLQTQRCGSRALILCFQGFLLKHLMFNREYASVATIKNSLQPTDFERRRALCGAVCEILWRAGNRTRCCLCLSQEDKIFDSDYGYRVDGITEKLHLYEFKKFQDLEMFVKRHLSHFENESSNGCILLLYSLILSRTVLKVYEDMGAGENDKSKLLTDNEYCTPALLNLLLTGRAVPNFHNGTVLYDDEGTLLPTPMKGVKERSEVGLLYWDKEEENDHRTEIGSMLKTPRSPIWLSIVNGQYGLLFSTNPDLVCEWRAEHHFTLYYYTGLSKCVVTPLAIETLRVPRSEPSSQPDQHLMNTRYTRRMRIKTGLVRKAREEKIPSLERCILTKWYGANIDWGGVFPYV